VTKDGITKDLEWMKRSGIAGFQLADVNAGSGQTVNDPVVFGSPSWLDAVRHAAAEADRLNLEMAIFSSPGWSLTGGSWVKPGAHHGKALQVGRSGRDQVDQQDLGDRLLDAVGAGQRAARQQGLRQRAADEAGATGDRELQGHRPIP